MARHIEHALSRTKGRIEGPDGAAARLAINPHTLRSRMRKLGIDWRSYRAGRLEPERSESRRQASDSGIATSREVQLVSLNSKAFSGSALTVAVSLETSSSRYLAGKGRLGDLPRPFGKLVSSISMRTL